MRYLNADERIRNSSEKCENQIDKQTNKKKPDIKVKSFTKYLKNKKNEQKIEEILLNIDQ